MSSAFKLFSVRGIDIRVHITFPLILVWAALQFGFLSDGGLSGAVFGVIVTSFLFIIVTLHELGHSVAAQYYGVSVKQIVLLPIGGVAQLERIPDKPWQEFVVAVAGPAVNVVLAILLGALAVLPRLDIVNPLSAMAQSDLLQLPVIFTYVFAYNIFLGVFNLLPAFPMDGGRVLRALLATRIDYMRATSIAVTIGQGLAWVFGLYGLISGNLFLILIAFFVYMGAGQERRLVEVRTLLRGVTVEQAYSRDVLMLSPSSTLQDAINLTLQSLQTSFPIVESGSLVGLLPYRDLMEAVNKFGPAKSVREVMRTDVKPVRPEEELFEVQERLRSSELDAAPVMDDGHFLGLLTSQDISEIYRLLSMNPNFLSKAERDRRSETPYSPITAGS